MSGRLAVASRSLCAKCRRTLPRTKLRRCSSSSCRSRSETETPWCGSTCWMLLSPSSTTTERCAFVPLFPQKQRENKHHLDQNVFHLHSIEAIKLCDLVFQANVTTLLPVFEDFMAQAPDTASFDSVRQSVVILMGSLAKHLDKDDPKVQPIAAKLIEALSTPSEQVSRFITGCFRHISFSGNPRATGSILVCCLRCKKLWPTACHRLYQQSRLKHLRLCTSCFSCCWNQTTTEREREQHTAWLVWSKDLESLH